MTVRNIFIDAGVKNPFEIEFDCITSSHVLEHSPNPLGFLTILYGMLKKGGTLFLEVPNCGLPYYWGEGDSPHLVFFSQESLVKVVEKAGFTVIECFSGGPSAINYVYPGYVSDARLHKNIIEALKTLGKATFPKGIIVRIAQLIRRLSGYQNRSIRQASLLKKNEELMEKEYACLYYKKNPDGVFLRILAKK